MQDAEPESARILAMTQDELDQAHDIFMITVHNGQSDMEPIQELTPEEVLAWTPEELEEFQQLILTEEKDMANIPAMTDTTMDGSANENADNTPSMKWEETDSEGVQLQSASSIWENLESQNEDGNSPTFSEKGRYAEHMQDMQDVAEWDMENFARQEEEKQTEQAAPKLHIIMIDCKSGSKDTYSSLDQFQEISNMLADTAVCKVLKPNEQANVHDFEQILEESLMHGT
jgi:hypothetical protein